MKRGLQLGSSNDTVRNTSALRLAIISSAIQARNLVEDVAHRVAESHR